MREQCEGSVNGFGRLNAEASAGVQRQGFMHQIGPSDGFQLENLTGVACACPCLNVNNLRAVGGCVAS